jgi:ribosomal protein S18 acetylase RimI-like enzyme
MKGTLRLAQPADAEQVQAISAAAYIPAYGPILGTAPGPAVEDYRPRIARGETWLLESASRPIATLILERHPDHILVYSIAVLPQHQRQGHARRLLAFAQEQARSAGRPEIRLYTNDRMTGNLALYRNCGFIEAGRRPHPTRAGITLVDFTKPV